MPNKIEELIDILNKNIQIEVVIGDYLHLEKRGKNYLAVCPFHADTNPSLSISPEKKLFKCFSCGVSGNVYKFIQNYKQLSFIDSLKLLADRYKIDYTAYLNASFVLKQKPIDPKITAQLLLNENALDFFKYRIENELNSPNSLVTKYLQKRDLSLEICKYFDLGFAPNDNQLGAYLLQKNYQKSELIAAGLINDREDLLDYFRNRLIFPIQNEQAQVVGFSGRVLDFEVKNLKYLNSKESLVFIKSEVIYNLHRAKEAIVLKKNVIIVEGFMDVIALYKLTNKNVVATMGLALSSYHCQTLKKLTKNIILSFDNDGPGITSIITNGKKLFLQGLNVFVALPPIGKDFDEYINKSEQKEYLITIENSQPFFDFYFDYSIKNFQLNNTFSFINQFLELLNYQTDQLIIDFYLAKISSILKIEKATLIQKSLELKKSSSVDKNSEQQLSQQSSSRNQKFHKVNEQLNRFDPAILKESAKKIIQFEFELFYLLINRPIMLDYFKRQNYIFNSQIVGDLYEDFIVIFQKDPSSTTSLLTKITSNEFNFFIENNLKNLKLLKILKLSEQELSTYIDEYIKELSWQVNTKNEITNLNKLL